MLKTLCTILPAAALLLTLPTAPGYATEAGWALLRSGGQVALINRANATSTHVPANTEERCRRQDGLSDPGRQQARRMGALFYSRAAPIEEVLASRACSSQETANLAFRDSGVDLDAMLDPLGADAAAAAERVETLREVIGTYDGSGNLILVTHPDVIHELTGVTPRDSEVLIVRPQDGTLHVAARITFN